MSRCITFNSSIYRKWSMWVGFSEAIRMFSTNLTWEREISTCSSRCCISSKRRGGKSSPNNKFNEWLAGVIDSNGSIKLSKEGYSLEVVKETRDKACLIKIKDAFGGSIRLRSGVNWLRYRLHHFEGIIAFLNSINGLLLNPVRQAQFEELCVKLSVEVIPTQNLIYSSAYLSGLMDSDGSINYNLVSGQVLITVSQKNRNIIDKLVPVYGGEGLCSRRG